MFILYFSKVLNYFHNFVCVFIFSVLASSGIDYDIKLWAPLEVEPNFDEERAAEVFFFVSSYQ